MARATDPLDLDLRYGDMRRVPQPQPLLTPVAGLPGDVLTIRDDHGYVNDSVWRSLPMAQSTLEQLKNQEALAKAQLAAAQRKLKALSRQQRALAAQAALQRQQAVGKLVEELGLPMDPDTLRPLLQALTGLSPADRQHGDNGSVRSGRRSTSTPTPEEAHLADDNLPLDHAEGLASENLEKSEEPTSAFVTKR